VININIYGGRGNNFIYSSEASEYGEFIHETLIIFDNQAKISHTAIRYKGVELGFAWIVNPDGTYKKLLSQYVEPNNCSFSYNPKTNIIKTYGLKDGEKIAVAYHSNISSVINYKTSDSIVLNPNIKVDVTLDPNIKIENCEDFKYNIGDTVKIRKDLKIGEDYGYQTFFESMVKFLGENVIIKNKYYNPLTLEKYYEIEDSNKVFTDEMIDDVTIDEKHNEEYFTIKKENLTKEQYGLLYDILGENFIKKNWEDLK
jgi:hypothetical protein